MSLHFVSLISKKMTDEQTMPVSNPSDTSIQEEKKDNNTSSNTEVVDGVELPKVEEESLKGEAATEAKSE